MNWVIQNQFFILLGLLLFAALAAGWFFIDIRRKLKIVFGGTKPGTDFQKDLIRRMARLETISEETEPRLKLVEEIAKISIQKVGFLRFNPFQDTGGDQSFILTLLDRKNNGVLVTSLYMREGMRLYAKSVEGGKTKQQLSEEEKGVLQETIYKGIRNQESGIRN